MTNMTREKLAFMKPACHVYAAAHREIRLDLSVRGQDCSWAECQLKAELTRPRRMIATLAKIGFCFGQLNGQTVARGVI